MTTTTQQGTAVVEAKDLVAGFMVISAKDLAEAVELSHGCPILGGSGSVEVRPVVEFRR